MSDGKRWTVQDRNGNNIYLTEERWKHIVQPINHPEMASYEEHLKETLKSGRRRQDPLNPRKYRYTKAFDDLAQYNTHIVVIVLFGFGQDGEEIVPNNYVVTAYQKEIG